MNLKSSTPSIVLLLLILLLVVYYLSPFIPVESFSPSLLVVLPVSRKQQRRSFNVELFHDSTTTPKTTTRLFDAAGSTSTSTTSTASTSTSTNTQAPQILKFKEPQTNVTVVLVGAMHYNPTSIQLAYDTVQQLAQQNALGSVVLELCDIRWNKTNIVLEQNPNLKPLYDRFFNNEMRTACTVALQYKRPVVLGDQRVNRTALSLQQTAKSTFIDLLVPIVGWKRLFDDVLQSMDESIPTGNVIGTDGTVTSYLNFWSITDPRLLLAAPVSFVRYPFSFLIRNPITTSGLFLFLFVLNSIADATTLTTATTATLTSATNQVPPLLLLDPTNVVVASSATASSATGLFSLLNIVSPDILIALFVSFVETILFARIFLRPMLAERNKVLAKNILEQCKLYQKTKQQQQQQNDNNENGAMTYWQHTPLWNLLPSQLRKQTIGTTTTTTTTTTATTHRNRNTGSTNTNNDDNRTLDFEIVYIPELIQAGISPIPTKAFLQSEEKVVVAILGMAHCNGIMKLLKEQKI